MRLFVLYLVMESPELFSNVMYKVRLSIVQGNIDVFVCTEVLNEPRKKEMSVINA